jgi:outer membrane protein assembly factor BamB
MVAVVGAIAGVVAVLVLMARISAPPEDGSPPADARALAAATTAPSSPAERPSGVRWRQALPAPASELYVTSVGVVAVTPTQVVVVDPDTGGVLDLIDSSEPTTVTDDGGLVTATADGLQVYDIQDGGLQWQSDISGMRPPAVSGGTLYGVSNDAVPQLIATDAQSGQRLWQFPGEKPAFPADTAVAPTDDFVYLADSQAVYGILPKGAAFGVDTAVIDANERAREPLNVWRAEADDELWLSSLRAVADGVVVAERAGNVCMRGRANGEPVWCLRVRGADGVEPAVFTTETQVFVVTPTAVTAIDARTGEEQWVQTGEWGDAVLGDGRLVVIAADGTVAALSITDGQAQTLHVAEGTGAPTVVAVDGDVLYAALDDGALVSVDMAEQLVRR